MKNWKNWKSIFAIALCVFIMASLFTFAACGVSQEEVNNLNQQIEDLNTKLTAAEKEAKDTKELLDKANADKEAAEKMIEQYKDKPVSGTDNVDYELSDDGKYYIATGLKEGSDATIVVIARQYNGLPVTEIAEEAFANQNEEKVASNEAIGVLKNVYIPDNVTVIGTKAFACCTQLQNAILEGPFDVDESGVEIFMECGMSYFKVPDGQKILPTGFLRANPNLATVVLPDGLEVIGENCFFSCNSIRDLYIPDSVKRIEWAAFYVCNKITWAHFPANIEYIGKEAFMWCVGMAFDEIVFGPNFKYIGEHAFDTCIKIGKFTFKVTDGWYTTTDPEATSGDAVDFSNPVNNATIITKEGGDGPVIGKMNYIFKHN